MLCYEPLWYEEQNDKILVWQGVCAIVDVSRSVTYFIKQANNQRLIFSVHCAPFALPLTSDGYYTCAEIRGTIRVSDSLASFPFYYHCSSPDDVLGMLHTATMVMQQICDQRHSETLMPTPYAPANRTPTKVQAWTDSRRSTNLKAPDKLHNRLHLNITFDPDPFCANDASAYYTTVRSWIIALRRMGMYVSLPERKNARGADPWTIPSDDLRCSGIALEATA